MSPKLLRTTIGVPIEQNHRIGSDEGSSTVNKGQYQRLVGKLVYLAHTRPEIAYVVTVVSQFMHDPRNRHLQAINKVLQYLKTSPGRELLFKRNEKLKMEVYTVQIMQGLPLIGNPLQDIACSWVEIW